MVRSASIFVTTHGVKAPGTRLLAKIRRDSADDVIAKYHRRTARLAGPLANGEWHPSLCRA